MTELACILTTYLQAGCDAVYVLVQVWVSGLAGCDTVQSVSFKQFGLVYASQVEDLVDHGFDKFTEDVHKLLR